MRRRARGLSSQCDKRDSGEVEGSGRAMPVLDVQADGCPGADEIRAALGHMAASEAFRGSPQLVAFLRYVVEATLRGDADRIKGYTIAVEALGRARRLRSADRSDRARGGDAPAPRAHALLRERRQARSGADRPAARQLRAGFRRDALPPARPAPLRAGSPRVDAAVALGRRQLALARGRRRARCCSARASTAGSISGSTSTRRTRRRRSSLAAPSRASDPARARRPAYPVVFVGRVPVGRRCRRRAAGGRSLRGKLRDALARFDEIAGHQRHAAGPIAPRARPMARQRRAITA